MSNLEDFKGILEAIAGFWLVLLALYGFMLILAYSEDFYKWFKNRKR